MKKFLVVWALLGVSLFANVVVKAETKSNCEKIISSQDKVANSNNKCNF